jgi:hypothetical protein
MNYFVYNNFKKYFTICQLASHINTQQSSQDGPSKTVKQMKKCMVEDQKCKTKKQIFIFNVRQKVRID